ncbi:MAG TPA: hypothetical protein VIK95_02735 [Egibacteraceae bacterium]
MNRPLRVVLLLIAIAAAVVLLFTVVFPWVDRTFVNDPVLGTALLARG